MSVSFVQFLTHTSAHVINHIFLNSSHTEHASFFFLSRDSAESLRAETIIRSIIRQFLDPLALSTHVESHLIDLDKALNVDLTVWIGLLQYIIECWGVYFIFIDGLDECEAVERGAVLDALVSLAATRPNLRIFITSRDSLHLDLRVRPIAMQQVSMACDSLTLDIRAYVDASIQERLQNEELILGEPQLLAEIINTLTQHADGM